MSTPAKLAEIGQIAVNVSDVGTALKFYRDILGLTFLFSPNPNLAFLAAGSVRLMLTTPQGAGSVGHNSILYFKVDDIQATHSILAKRGVVFESEPKLIAKMPTHDLWMAFFRDSEKNLLSLMSEVARS